MLASVIIITKNQKEYLQETIPVLKNQKVQGDYEVIVVDSGSTDGAVEYAKKMQVKVIEIDGKNFNYARAFNIGVKKARGEIVIRLSGDCRPKRNDFIWQMTKYFRDKKVGGVYGKYTVSGRTGYGYPNGWEEDKFGNKEKRIVSKKRFLSGLIETGEERQKLFSFAGGCCAVRRDLVNKRPFNERMKEGEDGEYAWFVHLMGYDIVYNPSAEVLHEHRLKKVNSKKYLFEQHHLYYLGEAGKYWFERCLGKDRYRNYRYGML